jgi:microcystin-dependent protein
MAEPYLGEIRLTSFLFAPRGWALCNGQLLPINQNQALFALLGTTYGGDGRVNFALPDLRGRVPIHRGGGHTLGERSGSQTHTLSAAELPLHSHLLACDPNPGTSTDPAGRVPATAPAEFDVQLYANGPPVAMNAGAVVAAGGNQPHTNMQPYLVLNYVIALQGIFPSPN